MTEENRSPEQSEGVKTNDKPTDEELKELKAQLEAERAERIARETEANKAAESWRTERSNLETEVKRLTADLEALKAERETTLEALRAERSSLEKAAAKYRDLVTAANPGVPADLIQGTTIEEIEASVAKAKSLVEKVKAGIESQNQAAVVPAGAPARTTTTEGMSSREKIVYGIQQKRS